MPNYELQLHVFGIKIEAGSCAILYMMVKTCVRSEFGSDTPTDLKSRSGRTPTIRSNSDILVFDQKEDVGE